MGHYEMGCGGAGCVMVGAELAAWTRSPASVGGANTQSISVTLGSEIDEHCEHARAKGAIITQEPTDQFYGDRTYRTIDPEGHCWSFSTHVRDVTTAAAATAIAQPITAKGWGVIACPDGLTDG